jgi:cysteine sulfinate desulfinase/cysteine desulfurase-like protein
LRDWRSRRWAKEVRASVCALRENLREQITSQLDEVYINGSMEHRLPGSI